MVRKVVSEIVSYVNADLLERHVARFVPALSRRRLFKKPGHWDRIFPAPESAAVLHEEEPAHLSLRTGIDHAQKWLLQKQNPKDGHWLADLRADTTLESDMIMLYIFLRWQSRPVVRQTIKRLADYILHAQNADGGWSIYRNGPSEISATFKAYWALKMAGHSADDPRLAKARECLNHLGGIHKINSYSKFYLALFGLYDWAGVPAIPPEIMFFPKWFYFNIYEMSSWTRGIVIPLSIVWAKRPKLPVPDNARIDELFPKGGPAWVTVGGDAPPGEGFFSWRKGFIELDGFLKDMEGRGPYFLRGWALKSAERWINEHNEKSDGLAAIFPAMLNTILALKVLGHPDDHPVLQHNLKELEKFFIDRGENGIEVQPCVSPVWDTAISMLALAESGLRSDHPALVKATRWILDREIKIAGDWKVKNTTGPIGGWAFEYENAHYPDIDDTAMVLLALRRVKLHGPLALAREKSFLRGMNWLLSMQSSDGGWAAFDMDNTKSIFEKIPFADHNAMIDPPTSDITARVLEALGLVGYDKTYECVQKAITFLKRDQQLDGSWYGRWGVNYIYGTWQAVRGLTCVGESPSEPYIQNALAWLRSVQLPDGGWGERCDTYDDPTRKGKGPSTPSQTAWALMAFLSCGLADDPAVERGIFHLLSTQRADGTWDEQEFTGTGFPKVFYLEYTYYRHYFPLLALGMYQRHHRPRRALRKGFAPVVVSPQII